MDWMYFMILVITHSLAYWAGTQTQTDNRAEMYDVYMKWQHEKWLEERRDQRGRTNEDT